MKFILCTHKFIQPIIGGVDVFTDRVRRALQRLGHEVSVLAFDSSADPGKNVVITEREIFDQTKVIRLRFSFNERRKEAYDLAYDPELGELARRIFIDEQPDIVVIVNFYTLTFSLVDAAKSLGIPVTHIATDFLPVCRRATFVQWNDKPCASGEGIKACSACFVSRKILGRITARILGKLPTSTLVKWANTPTFQSFPHPMAVFRPYWKQIQISNRRMELLQPLRQKIDLVLAPSRYIQKVFIENGFRSSQVFYLPYGVETDHPLSKTEHTSCPHVRFLFIGRLQPYKGVHVMVDAFNQLPSPKGATLTIYGSPDVDGPYFKQLKEKMAINERIKYGGQLDQEDLPRAFTEADYFILPSLWHENTPLTVLEALQSKTPVISSNIAGVTDLIKNNQNGLLFPMGDQGALTSALQRVIDQPELKNKFISQSFLISIDQYVNFLISHSTRSLIS